MLRMAVGVIFIYHSIPKLQEPKKMAAAMGWHLNQVIGLGIVEFISALAVIGGVATRLGALALVVVMAGAIYHKINKWHVPFAGQSVTGWEFDMLLLVVNLTIFFK